MDLREAITCTVRQRGTVLVRRPIRPINSRTPDARMDHPWDRTSATLARRIAFARPDVRPINSAPHFYIFTLFVVNHTRLHNDFIRRRKYLVR